MGICTCLSALAMRPIVEGVCQVLGVGSDGTEAVAALLKRQFHDPSGKLNKALASATDQAWRVLELALAGDSLWERCKGLLASAEHRAFREQVRLFLEANPLEGFPSHNAKVRAQCLSELQAARKAGLLTGEKVEPTELVQQASHFARYSNDPRASIAAEWKSLELVAGELKQRDCHALAQLVSVRLPPGQPLLIVASRYFFRRQVETDAELARGLTFTQLDGLTQAQHAGFHGLNEALTRHSRRLDEFFTGLVSIVADMRGTVREVHVEVFRQGEVAADTLDRVKTVASGNVRLEEKLDRVLSQLGEKEAPALAAIDVDFPPLPMPPILGTLPQPGQPGTAPPLLARILWNDGTTLRTLHLLPLAVVEAGRLTTKPLCLRVEPVADPVNHEASLSISSHHLTLRYLGDGVELSDAGSSNGTFLRGARLPPGRNLWVEPGMMISVAEVLDLEFHLSPRRDVPADSAACSREALSHSQDAGWLQDHLIGADKPGRVSFLRIVRKNNHPEQEYALLYHSGVIGGNADALIRLPTPGEPARLLVHNGWLFLERTGAEPVTVSGQSLDVGRPLPLTTACDWTVGRTMFRLEY